MVPIWFDDVVRWAEMCPCSVVGLAVSTQPGAVDVCGYNRRAFTPSHYGGEQGCSVRRAVQQQQHQDQHQNVTPDRALLPGHAALCESG